jgi:bifunctional UDP-N-acetylglucosamine pyrophosphorylase/glucosamine-1-phosphate N-acetyltransferase
MTKPTTPSTQPTSGHKAAAIILAAGKGTRMRSDMPKVMHALAGTPMLGHVITTARSAGLSPLSLVISPEQTQIRGYVDTHSPDIRIAQQTEQLGTAHAVLAARDALNDTASHLVVLYGDTPLIRPETITVLLAALTQDDRNAVAILGFRPADAGAYGRIVCAEDGSVEAIIEYNDANDAERAISLCNSGVMVLRGDVAWQLLDQIDNKNSKVEYYLTDVIALARRHGYRAVVRETACEEVMGVNSRNELAVAEHQMQQRLRERAMTEGATLIAPETVFLSHDTIIGRDTIIEPHVVIGKGVTIGDNCNIRSFSHIEGATIAAHASIGPFARIRPNTQIGEYAKIGNFVELKAAQIAADAKISHLSYIGDATVGESANIGAGTITCNYDGIKKYRTTIGAGAFIGSNSALVAPVEIGAGAIIAAGSVITENVAPDALAVSRAPQEIKDGAAERFRTKHKVE